MNASRTPTAGVRRDRVHVSPARRAHRRRARGRREQPRDDLPATYAHRQTLLRGPRRGRTSRRTPRRNTTRSATSSRTFDAGDAGVADDVSATIDYSDCPDTYVVSVPTHVVVTAAATRDARTRRDRRLRDRQRHPRAPVPRERQRRRDHMALLSQRQPRRGRATRRTPTASTHACATATTTTCRPTSRRSPTSSATRRARPTSPPFGTVKTTTDTNDNTTSYTYDAFGRLDQRDRPVRARREQAQRRRSSTTPAQPDPWALHAAPRHVPRPRRSDRQRRVRRRPEPRRPDQAGRHRHRRAARRRR